jgi:hypothetical protein
LKYIENPLSSKEFLDKILKTDCILEIENNQGQIEKIAIDITLDSEKVEDKLQEINRSSFVKSRKELNIDRHWILIVSNNYSKLNSFAIAEKLYEAIDNNLQIVDLR